MECPNPSLHEQSLADRAWASLTKWAHRLRYVIAFIIISLLWKYEKDEAWKWVKETIFNVYEASKDVKKDIHKP